jgi:hypothetical protein
MHVMNLVSPKLSYRFSLKNREVGSIVKEPWTGASPEVCQE